MSDFKEFEAIAVGNVINGLNLSISLITGNGKLLSQFKI